MFVLPFRQWTTFSCGAAVFQMVMLRLGRVWYTHWHAIRMTKCYPHGVMFSRLRRLFLEHKLTVRQIKPTIAGLRRALRENGLVVLNDNISYRNDHAYLLTAATPAGFWCIDPVIGLPTWRTARRVEAGITEAFAVHRRG